MMAMDHADVVTNMIMHIMRTAPPNELQRAIADYMHDELFATARQSRAETLYEGGDDD